MIPANGKTDPFLISRIREKDMESIIDWFERNQQSFYTLGWSYLRNRQQMEDLFYKAMITIQEELPRFKRKTSFEIWASSIFIQTCRELSDENQVQDSKRTEPRQDVFNALDKLKPEDKEAIALTYLKGFSLGDSARILQIEAGSVKERIFSGIQSLRSEMGYGSNFEGCPEYHPYYVDYLGRDLDRPQKVEFEIHIYNCHGCQDDLAAFQDVMLTLTGITEEFEVPPGVMENVKVRLEEKEKRRQLKKKKRKNIGLAFAGVFALLLCTGFVTGSFSNLYYSWTEDNKELRTYLQQDLGERLDLEAESEGVKIKIKSVIADDVQTLVFYEITDMKKDSQYVLNSHDGVFVQNESEIMNREAYPRYSPPSNPSDIHDEKNVYQGHMSLLPLIEDSGTIELRITRLQKMVRDPDQPGEFRPWSYEEPEFAHGEWTFEIPVKKHPSVVHELNQETEIEGIPLHFDKLTIAPTATLLQFKFKNDQPEKKRIEVLNFDSIQAGDKKVKSDLYGSTFVENHENMEWNTFQSHFDSLYGEDLEELSLRFGAIQMTVQKPKTIQLNEAKVFPQTFEYLGSTISIDKVEVGFPTEIVISNHDLENREYDSLQFHVTGESEYDQMSMGMGTEGVLVDKHGKEYNPQELNFPFEEIEQPRFLETVQSFELHNNETGEKVIPKKLEIQGYSTTKYVDDLVKIEL
jgi:RNA polymerase sigma factor (sigma-70 family)